MSEDEQIKSAGDIQLRHMQLEDCESVAAIHADLDPSPWKTEQWVEAYKCYPDAWVVTSGGASGLVGYAIYQVAIDQAELLNIGIHRSEQEKGIGKDLLEASISMLPDEVTTIYLEVRRSNIPAINLYTKLGFEEVAVRRDYYPISGSVREDALVMKRAKFA